MRLASESDRIHAHGAEVIALSVDDDVRQSGMFGRWPTPHVRYVSDPGGDTYLKAMGLYDPEERGGIARPAELVIAPDGDLLYRHGGRDFADRTHDEALFAAIDRLDLPAIDPPPPGGPVNDVPDDLAGYFKPSNLVPYFRGNRAAAIAIAGRTEDRELRGIAREHRLMADATLAAWRQLHPRPAS